MNRFILRWAINAVALYAAVAIVPGIEQKGAGWFSIIVLALIFGFVNAFLGPLLKLLTCPLIILTLGLFTLVINTFLFALTVKIGRLFDIGIRLADPWFWSAFWGALVVSVVSIVLSLVLKDELK